MRHDRPVSELLDECAHELTEPFTRQDVLAWFRRHYPDVPPNTVSARIFGLTDSDAPSRDRYQFGGARPVLERVSRGLYRRAQGRPEQPTLFSGATAPRSTTAGPRADVVLVGLVRTPRRGPAPAAELSSGALFERRVRYARASGRPWFVLSPRWGLLAPDEPATPHEVGIGDTPPPYRHGWAEFVVGRLITELDPEATALAPGTVIEAHAGDHYLDALRPATERAGGTLTDPVVAHSLTETLAWYDERLPDDDA